MALALGDFYAGTSRTTTRWSAEILGAARRAATTLWRFPLHPRYRRYVDSTFADMKNSSDLRQGSPVLAAEFLREFAGEGPWAHVDMAGPGFLERSRGDYLRARGGTGYGVRLIVELASRARSARTSTSSQEHELVRQTVRDFARAAIAPVAEELDREKPLPVRARRASSPSSG